MDLQQKLALLDLDKVNMQGAGQNSTFRKAGDPTIEAILIDNAEGRPPLNFNVDLDQDQVKSVGGDYSTPLFGGQFNVGGKVTLPTSVDDPFMGGGIEIPGNTQINAGWRNKNVGLNINYGPGGPSVGSQFGASF